MSSSYNISYKIILENFYDVVLKKGNPICSFQDAFHTIKLLEYCKKACVNKREVKVTP